MSSFAAIFITGTNLQINTVLHVAKMTLGWVDGAVATVAIRWGYGGEILH